MRAKNTAIKSLIGNFAGLRQASTPLKMGRMDPVAIQALDRRLDVIEDILRIASDDSGEDRIRTIYGIGRHTAAGAGSADTTLNNIPAYKRAKLYCIGTVPGRLTALRVNNLPVPTGDLHTASLDPTLGQDRALVGFPLRASPADNGTMSVTVNASAAGTYDFYLVEMFDDED